MTGSTCLLKTTFPDTTTEQIGTTLLAGYDADGNILSAGKPGSGETIALYLRQSRPDAHEDAAGGGLGCGRHGHLDIRSDQ